MMVKIILLCFIGILYSCGNNLDNQLNKKINIDLEYNKIRKQLNVEKNNVESIEDKILECTIEKNGKYGRYYDKLRPYNRETCDNETKVKVIYLNFIIPGFTVKTIDPYSPIICRCISENIPMSDCTLIKNIVLSRWYHDGATERDNLKYLEQRKNLQKQVFYYIDAVLKTYINANICVTFICESYGGKIAVFFINDSYDDIVSTRARVSICKLVTLHSPLYEMDLAKYMISSNKRMMLSNLNNFIGSLKKIVDIKKYGRIFTTLELLNPALYHNTYKILGKSDIDNINIDVALAKILKHGIKIVNIIGTPDTLNILNLKFNHNTLLDTVKNIHKLISKMYQDIINGVALKMVLNEALSFLKNTYTDALGDILDQINIDTICDNIPSTDLCQSILGNLKELLQDLIGIYSKSDYINSDFLVTVSQTVKNSNIIKDISNSRDEVRIYESNNIIYVTVPQMQHIGNPTNDDLNKIHENLKSMNIW